MNSGPRHTARSHVVIDVASSFLNLSNDGLHGRYKNSKDMEFQTFKVECDAMHNFEIYSCFFFIKQHKLHLLDLHTDGEFCNCWYIKYTL